MISQADLKGILQYAPDTGLFYWRKKIARKVIVGNVAGTVGSSHGYRAIKINGTIYLAHRLAWLYMTGAWSIWSEGHINGDRLDNSWANLRECTAAQNRQNRAVHADTGYFDTQDEAFAAYKRAKAELHDFAPELRAA